MNQNTTQAHARPALSAHAVDAQLHAYNSAFYELGLRWHWDRQGYHCGNCEEEQRSHLRRYLEVEQPHLLNAYDAEFLVNAIQSAKARWLDSASLQGTAPMVAMNWAAFQQPEVGF